MDTAVLMVLDSVFPARGGGGAESQVATLCAGLRSLGIQARVIVPLVRDGPTATDELVSGTPVHRLAYPRIRGLGMLVLLLRLAWHLVARRHEYTVIHAHIAMWMAAVSALVGRALGKTVIVKITGMTELRGGILDPAPRLSMRVLRRLMRHATAMQATSEYIRDRLVEVGFDPDRVVLIPNAVDDARFTVTRAERAAGPDRRDRLEAVYVGRLESEKGVEVLLRAWADAFGADGGCRLTLVGEGQLRPPLQDLTARLGIAGSVVFAGHSDRVQEHLASAELGILPSFAEGLSNTMLEYMAAGLPVIASRVSGAPDFVVTGTSGWLFEPGDVAGLAARLREARAIGPARREALGRTARDLVRSKAGRSSVLAALMREYGGVPLSGVHGSCAE